MIPWITRRRFLVWGAGALAVGAGAVNGGVPVNRRKTEGQGAGDRAAATGKSTTLILGAGVGGIVTARLLREALPDSHHIQVVERAGSFHMGTTKTWVMLGRTTREEVERPFGALSMRGIQVIRSHLRHIDLERKTAETSSEALTADYLVIALGADVRMAAIPGLAESGETFYTMPGAVRLRGVLDRFDGGRIVFLVPRAPFKCPPGPYEGAMLLHARLKERGLRERTHLSLYTVEKSPMATAGPRMGEIIRGALAERAIEFHAQAQVHNVEPENKVVVLEDGTKVPFDLLIAVPPHETPAVVGESGLGGPSGWIPVDPTTLELGASPHPHRVFAIGDVASVPLPGRFQPDAPLTLPKAGTFAESQAAVVAARIAAHVLGKDPSEVFAGRGYCYIETGTDAAMRGDGSFFDLPHPNMTATEPDARQAMEKRLWVEKWMKTYL